MLINITDPKQLRVDDRITAVHNPTQSEVTGTVSRVTLDHEWNDRADVKVTGVVVKVAVGNTRLSIIFFDDERGWVLEDAIRKVPDVEPDTTGTAVSPAGYPVRGYVSSAPGDSTALMFTSVDGMQWNLSELTEFSPSLPTYPADTGERTVERWMSDDKSVEVPDEEPITAADVNRASAEKARSLYAPKRDSYGKILTVEELRAQIANAKRRLALDRNTRKMPNLNVLTFGSWPFSSLSKHGTDVESLKERQEHRVRMLNAQAEADGETVRFTFRESASGFRIDVRDVRGVSPQPV